MSEVTPFKFDNHDVRVITDERGEPWFVGKDICDALGYKNASDAMNDHCRGVAKRYPIADSLGRMQETRVISEPDVMRLMTNSTMPEAEKFERLVFEEILPTIRKTGSYSAKGGAKPTPPFNSAVQAAKTFPNFFRVARLIGLDKNAAAISANQAVYQITGTNMLTMLGQTHIEAEKQELVFNVSDLSDGISGMKMNRMLQAAGMQINEEGRWIPTELGKKFSRVFDAGKKHGNGTPVQQIKWFREVLNELSIAEAA